MIKVVHQKLGSLIA